MPYSTYLPERMGTAVIEPADPLEAGSYAELVYTYTAGYFGIDDTGSIKISWRTTSDMGKPQLTDPTAANYVSIEASNGAVLETRFDRVNIRPWAQTLFIRLKRGFMREGDRIIVRFGDRRQGSPGFRMQTNAEATFEFKTVVDAFATYDFVELPASPTVALVPGPAARWKAILPTQREVGQPFRLAIVAEDSWGNPTERAAATLNFRSTLPVEGLPRTLPVQDGQGPVLLEGLTVAATGDLTIDIEDAETGRALARSNPLRIERRIELTPYWADLHGQSEETIGTNSAEDYFLFARDKAFIDVVGHQGNDFQITQEFWSHLNELMQRFNDPGRFVTIPGYEWSGNTGMGGDRNVFYFDERQPIFRSSHVLVHDRSDAETDCHTAPELFKALAGRNAVAIAHVGGRYADLHAGHDGRIERSVEVHSTWGTFEWLLHDAFELGFRVGVVCHSDDHKGRQGATSPGASMFGAIGGLTCLLMPELTRKAVFDALRRRRHYGTTGTRLFLDVRAEFEAPATVFADDPALGPATSVAARSAMMGDIVRANGAEIVLGVEAIGSAPIERLVVFNGTEQVAMTRPFVERDLGRRIRVLWEGAEYRGRGRETIWDGRATLAGNRYTAAHAVNFLNPEKRLVEDGGTGLSWRSVTTGNFAGFDIWLDDPNAGELQIQTGPVTASLPIAEIGWVERVFEGGGLGRRIRMFRLPDENPHSSLRSTVKVPLKAGIDNPIYVRLTQEDGHQAWSSPIYLIP